MFKKKRDKNKNKIFDSVLSLVLNPIKLRFTIFIIIYHYQRVCSQRFGKTFLRFSHKKKEKLRDSSIAVYLVPNLWPAFLRFVLIYYQVQRATVSHMTSRRREIGADVHAHCRTSGDMRECASAAGHIVNKTCLLC